jgi:hypothetical protein
MSRGSEQIDAATLTVGICTQPEVLAELGDTPAFRGQGLLGRMPYSASKSLLGYRNPRPAPIPEHIAQQYGANLRSSRVPVERRPTSPWTDRAVPRCAVEPRTIVMTCNGCLSGLQHFVTDHGVVCR